MLACVPTPVETIVLPSAFELYSVREGQMSLLLGIGDEHEGQKVMEDGTGDPNGLSLPELLGEGDARYIVSAPISSTTTRADKSGKPLFTSDSSDGLTTIRAGFRPKAETWLTKLTLRDWHLELGTEASGEGVSWGEPSLELNSLNESIPARRLCSSRDTLKVFPTSNAGDLTFISNPPNLNRVLWLNIRRANTSEPLSALTSVALASRLRNSSSPTTKSSLTTSPDVSSWVGLESDILLWFLLCLRD